jgi:hypothetical protein
MAASSRFGRSRPPKELRSTVETEASIAIIAQTG